MKQVRTGINSSIGKTASFVLVLSILNTINYMDRALMAILAQPVKKDLQLTDVEIGLLSGFAFALVYSLLALPLSRFIDRGNHKIVIAVSTGVWSIMTTLGGFAHNFWTLVIMRVGVAIGEAGLHPASHSLISLRLPPSSRGRALAVFAVGLPIGVALGSIFGGWLTDSHGWRAAFLVLGPVGLLMLPLILLFVPSTKSNLGVQGEGPAHSNAADLLPAIRTLWKDPVFRYLFIGQAIVSMFGFALTTFVGAFFMRVHGWTALEAGSFIAIANGFGGSVGLLAGGAIFDLGMKKWPAHALFPVAVALFISGICASLGWLSPYAQVSAACGGVAAFFYLVATVPTVAMAQTIAAPNMRATASALITLSASLLGATAGPLLAGAISDLLTPGFGPRAIAWALSIVSAMQIVGAFFYWQANREYAARLKQPEMPGQVTA
ncbi:MFS transporter [Sphingobium sp.]|uniref:spinster family MFS transporter n=1 Tax=Sphingobium sp. TaxID=1912891 RepID=UPI0028BD80CB|nr:MFS transporter [Sphingobium sp.]